MTFIGAGRADLHDDRTRLQLNLLAFGTGCLLSVLLVGPLMGSWFSILDDHNIMAWLGRDGRLHTDAVLPTLMATEVGAFGEAIRFRPVYFTWLVVQAWLWGANPAGYHAFQIVSFAVLLWSVAWAAFRTVGVLPGLAAIFLLVSAEGWGDLWTYSFVPEQAAVFGTGLVIFGAGCVLREVLSLQPRNADGWLLLLATGVIICAGSKENFIILIGGYLLVVGLAWWRKALSPVALAAGHSGTGIDGANGPRRLRCGCAEPGPANRLLWRGQQRSTPACPGR